ncbi:TPA: hypothetical protein QC443_005569 [Bacillus cereus]|nr:hypothetical protein [Bacillus cereus]HDR8214947.1 hypothetical protein [Bacillus cereus]HDR8227204.1 hypothetical protein [Bacillus cereus]HDR8239200.1 hypothetical protein [Bacillus cereus]HDR8288734.1 hypothetical protein [Bacillus cereus]
MKNDLFDTYFIYSSKEISEKVGIQTPTVRKYGQLLESYGYVFEKNGKRRNFTDRDIVAMKKMKESSNIERTAKELAEAQNKSDTNDMKGDTLGSDMSISPSDTALIPREFQQEMIKSEKRYNEMVGFIQGLGNEVMETKEKLSVVLDELEASKKREAEQQKVIDDMNQKLGKAVDLLMKMEEKELEIAMTVTEKESVWTKWFGIGKKNKVKDSL